MEESIRRKKQNEGGDKEIIYSKAIKAGKRIYYLDVKKNLNNDLFLALTESKKIQAKDGSGQISFEKHKIFLYKEDFDKFMEGMADVLNYIRKHKGNSSLPNNMTNIRNNNNDEWDDEIKWDVHF